MDKKTIIPKPILKWVGGKTQILHKLIQSFPKNINNYHEIFLGGGSVLIALLINIKQNNLKLNGNIYAYDLNSQLINMYINIQLNHSELYDIIQILIKEYNECAEPIESSELEKKPRKIWNNLKDEDKTKSKEHYYYWIRQKYNKMTEKEKNSVNGSAIFIFLNKTCFRGLFRMGANGFNVPYGNYKNPEIVNKEHLKQIHELIQNVIFECKDFNDSLDNVKTDDFVYLDPPYAPENKKSFVKYNSDGFDEETHLQLFKKTKELNYINAKFVMSNADVSLVNDSFNDNDFNIEKIECRRAINSKNPESKTMEVIINTFI